MKHTIADIARGIDEMQISLEAMASIIHLCVYVIEEFRD